MIVEKVIRFKIPYPEKRKEKTAFLREYGLNSIYAGKHWAKRNQDKTYWRYLVRSELEKQEVPREFLKAPVSITFWWDDGLDCSNHAYMAKMIEDILVGYLFPDDSRKYVSEITHRFHGEGYILVEVREAVG